MIPSAAVGSAVSAVAGLWRALAAAAPWRNRLFVCCRNTLQASPIAFGKLFKASRHLPRQLGTQLFAGSLLCPSWTSFKVPSTSKTMADATDAIIQQALKDEEAERKRAKLEKHAAGKRASWIHENM